MRTQKDNDANKSLKPGEELRIIWHSRVSAEKRIMPFLRAIKEVKYQANTLLQKGTTSCVAWRIDMAKLFERYVQYVVSKSLRGFDSNVMSNYKIRGKGQIAQWGLKHLEPDMIT